MLLVAPEKMPIPKGKRDPQTILFSKGYVRFFRGEVKVEVSHLNLVFLQLSSLLNLGVLEVLRECFFCKLFGGCRLWTPEI